MKFDLHIHTTAYSACSVMSPDEAAIAAKRAGLDGICLTEHNKIWTAEDAAALARKHDLVVIRGVEITTTGGDIVAFGIEEEPDEMWTPAMLKERVDRSDGLAIAAHPFRGFLLFGFSSLSMDIKQAADNPTFSSVHALEICNGMVTDEENELAGKVADELNLIKVGGSDAHKPESVGTCVTEFEDEIRNERDLIKAILAGSFQLKRTG